MEKGDVEVCLVEIVEDDDLLLVVCKKEKAVGLVKPHHFYVKSRFDSISIVLGKPAMFQLPD